MRAGTVLALLALTAAASAASCIPVTNTSLMAGGTFRLYNHPTAEWTRAG